MQHVVVEKTHHHPCILTNTLHLRFILQEFVPPRIVLELPALVSARHTVVLLAVAYELKSPRMAEWKRQGWIAGWKSVGCVPSLVV